MINFYKSKDLTATKAFYTKLNLTIYFENENSIILDSQEGMIGFVYDEKALPPAYSCVSFDLKDIKEVNAVYQEVKDIATTEPHHHPQFPVYSFFLKDPNGINVEYQTIIR